MKLEIKNGTFGYDGHDLVLKDVNVTVEEGQIAAILASATDTQTEIASQIGQMA